MIPETKARQKAAFGKADFGIAQRETWGRRVSAHVFLRYMDKELHEKIIRDKQQFKKQADRMRADFAALGMDEKAFKKSRVYKDWHDEYMAYKFRVNQDVERWVGMTEFKDFKDDNVLALLENGVRLPAQQLLRNIGTVREYSTKRTLDGNTEDILTVDDGDALVSMESAQRQFLVLPTKYKETRTKKDGTKPTEHEERLNPIALAQRRWMIWKVADRAGIRRNAGEFDRAQYFEALLDMFDHPEEANTPKAVLDTLDAVEKGQIDEARKHLRRLHPEWVILNSVSDARAERITDAEIDDLLAEIVGDHASNDVIYQYHGNTRREAGETAGMARETRSGNSRTGSGTTRENEGVESRAGQSGSADLLSGRPKWRTNSQQRATPGQKVLSDAAARAGGGALSMGRREITPEQKAEVERQLATALTRLKDEGRIRDDGLVFAPNGKPSILYQSLLDWTGDEDIALRRYALVHTPNFKRWFGDWERPQKHVSKIVDSNGEPLIVYHGSQKFKPRAEGIHFGSLDQARMRNPDNIYAAFQRVRESGISEAERTGDGTNDNILSMGRRKANDNTPDMFSSQGVPVQSLVHPTSHETRTVPKQKPAKKGGGRLEFLGNLFGWQNDTGKSNLPNNEQSGSIFGGNRGGSRRVGGRGSGSSLESPTDRTTQNRDKEGDAIFGDLFAYGARKSDQTESKEGDRTGQSGSERGGDGKGGAGMGDGGKAPRVHKRGDRGDDSGSDSDRSKRGSGGRNAGKSIKHVKGKRERLEKPKITRPEKEEDRNFVIPD